MDSKDPVIQWLLSSDVSIRWQVMRDLLDEPESVWSIEKKKVEKEGWGKELLSHQDEDGQWAGGSFAPKDVTMKEFEERQPWSSTAWVLSELRILGLDPSSASAQRTVKLVGENCRWDHDGQRFWDGEVEECINGRAAADGAYFGVDMAPLIKTLLETRLEDGGWNCERERGSLRSSFDTTISVLEGLLEFEKATGGGTPESVKGRHSGEEYLLKRDLFRRASTGQPIKEQYTQLLSPSRWKYDILRGLDYMRAAYMHEGKKPDPRMKDAIEILRSKKTADGKWLLERDLPGRRWVEMNDGVGKPSPWLTLMALRVLRWWDEAQGGN
ncbi:hypothetical protein K4F52_004534 [Lecanicillium sp. MT-2017a]|nr:hypothetical protein K4F52_004534 [Lecanicillium sp. MT-2017a]